MGVLTKDKNIMNKYQYLVTQHNTLSDNIISALKAEIDESKLQSKHITNSKAISVNVFDYIELVIVNDKLTFLNSQGNHHSLYADCINNDLIDILYNLEEKTITY